MSGLADVIFNNLERALSTDINALQSLQDRDILEIFRNGNASLPMGFGGLNMIPDGNNVSVQPGLLMQFSNTLAPVPTAIDSAYRYGIQRAAETIAMPSPGAESWVVIEAQAERVITLNTIRDIFNPGTGLFTPTAVDKRSERQLAYQILTGAGTVPAFTGGDWVPIAIVRRPGGGGPVAATDIYDLRRLYSSRFARSNEPASAALLSQSRRGGCYAWSASLSTGAVSNLIVFDSLEGYASGGDRLFLHSGTAGVDVAAADILQNGLVLAANTWYYLYLAPFRGLPIGNAYPGRLFGRGLIVVSNVAPDAGLNSGAINMPAPWNTAPAIGAGEAVLMLPLLRNNTNDGWLPFDAIGNRVRARPSIGASSTFGFRRVANLTPPAASNAIAPAANVPVGVESHEYVLQHIGAGAAPARLAWNACRSGGAQVLDGPHTVDDDAAALDQERYLSVPTRGLGTVNFQLVNTGPGAINAGSALAIDLIGFTL